MSMMAHEPSPELWANFNFEKTSQKPKLREALFRLVNLSIPAQRSDRDVVEEIARASQIPIEFLCEELSQSVYPRGQLVLGYAGDELDKVTQNYQTVEWWVSDRGLNMTIVTRSPSNPNSLEFLNSRDKGNVGLLRGMDGNLKTSVTVDTAARFGGIGKRAIEKAVRKGAIETSGARANRRILVA